MESFPSVFCIEIWYSVLCKDKLVNWTKPTVLDLIKIHPPDSFSSLVYTSYSPTFSGCLKPQACFNDKWTEFLTLMVCMSLPIQTKWSPRARSASGHATPEGSSVRLETTQVVFECGELERELPFSREIYSSQKTTVAISCFVLSSVF